MEHVLDNSRAIGSSSVIKLVDILTQNVLIHPFISLRRICQVNRRCSPLVCVQPFTLIPFIYHQQKQQGLSPLFKGLSSELTVKALMAGTEAAVSNYTEWPREFTKRRFIENFFKRLALKALSVTLATPFLCSSAIETVQSAIVVKDRPAFVECLKEGLLRLLHLRYMPSTRLLPIWILIGPTILYHVSHVVVVAWSKTFVSIAKNLINSNRLRSRRKPLSHDDDISMLDDTMNDTKILELHEVDSDYCEISTQLTATFIADIALFPIETVMHSLYLQGSRAIVDNCDETTVVLPVITNYDGFIDCYQSIMKMEGTLGLYKGLGALFLQFSLHYMIIRLTHYAIREYTDRSSSKKSNHNNRTIDSTMSPNETKPSNYSLRTTSDNRNLVTHSFRDPSQDITTPIRRK